MILHGPVCETFYTTLLLYFKNISSRIFTETIVTNILVIYEDTF